MPRFGIELGGVTKTPSARYTFMEECGKVEGCYKWPSSPDELKIPVLDIVKTINEPVPTGKSKRFFKIQ